MFNTVRVEKYLKINGRIEVRPAGNEEGYYKSMINGVKNRLFLVTPPYRGRDNLYLYKGDDVEVILIGEKEKILFQAKVVDRVSKPLFGYVLEAPEEGTRIQMRDFVRVKVALKVEWGIMAEDMVTGQELEQVVFKPAIMVDISGGGAGIVVREPVPENTRIILRFTLPLKNMEVPMSLLAEVRRCQPLNEPNRYLVGVAFVGLPQRDQDQIIEYVFQRQREQRLLEND